MNDLSFQLSRYDTETIQYLRDDALKRIGNACDNEVYLKQQREFVACCNDQLDKRNAI